MPHKSWIAYLTDQPIKYPDYFKTPFSKDAQIYFKKILELVAERSIKMGLVAGFYKFLDSVENETAKSLMITWIETYTPIRTTSNKKNEHQLIVVKEFINRCNLISGLEHPFYTIKEKPRKIYTVNSYRSIQQFVPKENDSVALNVTAAAKTEHEFNLKILKIAFNEFILERSIEKRTKLISRIMEFPIGELKKGRNPTLQGGLPSLGRR